MLQIYMYAGRVYMLSVMQVTVSSVFKMIFSQLLSLFRQCHHYSISAATIFCSNCFLCSYTSLSRRHCANKSPILCSFGISSNLLFHLNTINNLNRQKCTRSFIVNGICICMPRSIFLAEYRRENSVLPICTTLVYYLQCITLLLKLHYCLFCCCRSAS